VSRKAYLRIRLVVAESNIVRVLQDRFPVEGVVPEGVVDEKQLFELRSSDEQSGSYPCAEQTPSSTGSVG
jgi:hypothetical protein